MGNGKLLNEAKHTLSGMENSLQSPVLLLRELRSTLEKIFLSRENNLRSDVLFLAGRGVAQPGLARHLGVVEVARSNRVAPIFLA